MKLSDFSREEILASLGLQQKDTIASVTNALVYFGIGILVGAGTGLLLAPKSGVQMRKELKDRLRSNGRKGIPSQESTEGELIA